MNARTRLVPAQLYRGEDVVRAVADEMLHVYAVRTVDEAISLLTDMPAGERNAFDEFPAGSVNGRVAEQLRAFSPIRQSFAAAAALAPSPGATSTARLR